MGYPIRERGQMKRRLAILLAITAVMLLSLSIGVKADPPVQIQRGFGATYIAPERCGELDPRLGSSYYNWGPTPPVCPGWEAVPMIWGKSQIGAEVGGNSLYLMGFNEPDCIFQSRMNPEEGAQRWRELEAIYPDRLLISPGVMEVQWLRDFIEAYIAQTPEGESPKPPRLQGLAVHCYVWADPENSVKYCKGRVQETIALADQWSIPEVWLTEFAYLCDPSGAGPGSEYLRKMMFWLESEPRVTRYMWFQWTYAGTESWSFGSACNTSLVKWETEPVTLTPYGEVYSRRISKVYLPLVMRGPGGLSLAGREPDSPPWVVEPDFQLRRCIAKPCTPD